MPPGSSENGAGIKETLNDIRDYLEKRLELFVLTLSDRITFMLADAIQRIVGILLLAGGFMVAWFALSFYLSELLGSHALGFLAGSLPLLIIGLIFVAVQPVVITRRIQYGMLSQFMAAFDAVRESEDENGSNGESKGEAGGSQPAGEEQNSPGNQS